MSAIRESIKQHHNKKCQQGTMGSSEPDYSATSAELSLPDSGVLEIFASAGDSPSKKRHKRHRNEDELKLPASKRIKTEPEDVAETSTWNGSEQQSVTGLNTCFEPSSSPKKKKKHRRREAEAVSFDTQYLNRLKQQDILDHGTVTNIHLEQPVAQNDCIVNSRSKHGDRVSEIGQSSQSSRSPAVGFQQTFIKTELLDQVSELGDPRQFLSSSKKHKRHKKKRSSEQDSSFSEDFSSYATRLPVLHAAPPLSFKTPTGFVEVEPSDDSPLWWEDIAGKQHKELFLVRAPVEFLPSELHHQTGFVGRSMPLTPTFSQGKNYEITISPAETANVSGSMVVILPSKQDHRYHVASEIHGLVTVSRKIVSALPSTTRSRKKSKKDKKRKGNS